METPSPVGAAPTPRRRFHFRLVPPLFLRPRRAYGEIVRLERPSWLTPLLILSLAALLPVLALGRVRQQAGAFGADSRRWGLHTRNYNGGEAHLCSAVSGVPGNDYPIGLRGL